MTTKIYLLSHYKTVNVSSRFNRVQLFVTLWTVCSLSGSSVHGILQARILEWIAMASFRGSNPNLGIKSRLGDRTCVSYVSCIGRWVLYQ